MKSKHITTVSNKSNPYVFPGIGAALGTIATGIGAYQLYKGGANCASVVITGVGMGIKGFCDCALAHIDYHQDLQEQEDDRRNLNGSKIEAREGKIDLERKRMQEIADLTLPTPWVYPIQQRTQNHSEGKSKQ